MFHGTNCECSEAAVMFGYVLMFSWFSLRLPFLLLLMTLSCSTSLFSLNIFLSAEHVLLQTVPCISHSVQSSASHECAG